MKKIILIVLPIFLIEHNYCDVDLLSKFHQTGYKIKDVRSQVISYDKTYYEILNIKTFKYNRTTTAQNFTIRYKKNVYERLEILVQGFKLLSNEYRHFPIRFQVNLCKAFKANIGGVLNMMNCGNITSCHLYKDVTYQICNFVVDDTYFPPLIPTGQFKMQLQILDVDKVISVVDCFGEIYIPIVYPKK